MDTLVKLNLTARIDVEIYNEEYNRITGEIESLQTNRSGVTEAETIRNETLGRGQEIASFLRKMEGGFSIQS